MSGPDRNRRLEQLFHAALEQPGQDRRAFVERACRDDPELLARLLRMLELDGDGPDDPLARAVGESVRELGAAPAAGRRLGAWKIVDELGAGGMGTVFLAERADGEYEAKAAIKVIRGLPDAAGLERLKRERQILAELHHPNIARLLDGGTTDDGQPFLVIEYVDGRPIDRWCRQHPCTPAAIVRLLLQVLDAVEYAHRHLVIHRDIKPGNVLVTDDGHPALMDFGIARLLAAEDSDSEPATVGGVFHTPGFASPEQVAGGRVTTASDIYSLGRLLADLLGAAIEPVPRELRAVIEKATRDEPEQRYSSAGALRADLAAWLDSRPVSAVSGRRAYRVRKFIARNRYIAGTAAAGLALALVLVGQLVQENRRARAAEGQARIEAANAEQVLAFLTSAIEAVEPGRAQGREVTMLEIIERAERQLSGTRIREPRLRTRILQALGLLYQTLEQNDKAAALLSRAAALACETRDVAAEVRALAPLGISQLRDGLFDAAGSTLERAVERVRAHPELPPLVRADALNSFGVWATEVDRLDEAREALNQALTLRREAGAAKEVTASTLHNLALLQRRAGNPEAAAQSFARTLELKRQSIGTLHPSYIRSLNSRAVVLRQLGRYRQARDDVSEALEIGKRLFGPEHPSLHGNYNELAIAHHDLGEFQQAVALYRKAIELDALATAQGRSWIYLNNLAAAFEDRGELARAEEHYRRSIGIRRAQFGDDHSATLRARHNLARILFASGRVEQARELCTVVLNRRGAELGDDHPDTLKSRFLATQIALSERPGDRALLERLQGLVGKLEQALSPTSFSVLNARTALGRAWLAAGNLQQARTVLEATAADFREALNPDHPLAAAIELELARIDRAENRADRAQQRLAEHGPTVRAHLAPGSQHVQKLECLAAGDAQPACWGASQD